MRMSSDDDPKGWRLEVDQECIDLYARLSEESRPLTLDECSQLMALVDAWRAHEHRKHVALMNALSKLEQQRRS